MPTADAILAQLIDTLTAAAHHQPQLPAAFIIAHCENARQAAAQIERTAKK